MRDEAFKSLYKFLGSSFIDSFLETPEEAEGDVDDGTSLPRENPRGTLQLETRYSYCL
jgi:hypothetical protein